MFKISLVAAGTETRQKFLLKSQLIKYHVKIFNNTVTARNYLKASFRGSMMTY